MKHDWTNTDSGTPICTKEGCHLYVDDDASGGEHGECLADQELPVLGFDLFSSIVLEDGAQERIKKHLLESGVFPNKPTKQ